MGCLAEKMGAPYPRSVIVSGMLAMLLVQAPPSPAAFPVTAPPREWNLAGEFILKQEIFVRWQPVVDPARPYKGLYSERRSTWLLELTPTNPKLSNVSLMVESLPAFGSGVGIVRPKLSFRVPGTQFRINFGVRLRASYDSSRRR